MKSQSLKLRERAKVGRIRQVGFVCVVSQNSKCKKATRFGENFYIKIKKTKKTKKDRNKKQTAQSSKRRNTCKNTKLTLPTREPIMTTTQYSPHPIETPTTQSPKPAMWDPIILTCG